MSKIDPIAAALDAAKPIGNASNRPRMLVLFGDRPDVLDAVRRARRDRHLSTAQIARLISTPGATIGESAVKTWLALEGID